MGKRIIQQARGHGSLTYRVRQRAFKAVAKYPMKIEGELEVLKLINSSGHSAPLVKLRSGDKIFFNMAAKGIYEGQKGKMDGENPGDISKIGLLKNSTKIFNIENSPNDGGRFVKTGGNSATVVGKDKEKIVVKMPSKKEKRFNANCRCTVGEIAGAGRLDKPILKAGKNYYIKKAKSKLWPRTSAVKMNAIDHPFGSGRGKRIKSKIAKRNSPPGKKVGLIRPRRTGRKKR